MQEKFKNRFKNFILILSVYFIWIVIFTELVSKHDSDVVPYYAIPFTILSIYIWNNVYKNK